MIYYVEDDTNIRDLTVYALKQAGFEAAGFPAAGEFFAACKERLPELVLLDIMLPEIDGLSILRSIRQNHICVPVILTTALGAVGDKIDGLDCGADDYLIKPYDIKELLARIRALSRRPNIFTEPASLTFSDISFEPDTRTLICRDKKQKLSKREAFLLEFFLRNPEKTLLREQIFSRIWGPDGAVEDGNLDTYIYFLRKHLRTLGSRVFIATIHGAGYRLEESHVS